MIDPISGLVGLVLGALVTLVIAYFKSFWSKAGENAAMQRNIGELTRLTEEVKDLFIRDQQERAHRNAEELEGKKFANTIRLAALDQRLAAHQEAYRRWRELIGALHTPDIHKRVYECQQWFDSNCLYLEQPARAAFYSAYHAAFSHSQPLSPATIEGEDYVSIHMANINRVTEAGGIIERCVALPALSAQQHEQIVKDGE